METTTAAQQQLGRKPCGISGPTERALNLTLSSVVGALEKKMPPKKQVAFSFPVPGTGPFDSSRFAGLAQGLGYDAKKGRKERDPRLCPEQDLNLQGLAATSS